jgi:hypothetical protein
MPISNACLFCACVMQAIKMRKAASNGLRIILF